tara:strand:+ start:240 stop:476 length:237 start_codon:yes stop_codon:yes gene_type:complete
METVKEKYIKGFNNAYLLKQHKPKLIESILNTTSNNDYIKGLKDGERIYAQQKLKSRSQELKDLNAYKNRNRDRGLER